MRLAPELQPEKVVAQLNGQHVRHGQGVRADIRGIDFRRSRLVGGMVRPAPYFCTSHLKVSERFGHGDNNPLPSEVVLVGDWDFPHEGKWDALNVSIEMNGRVYLIRDNRTILKRTDPDRDRITVAVD